MKSYYLMSNEELASEFRTTNEWCEELCVELCDRAHLLREWAESDGDTFTGVLEKAADILGVDIY